MNEETKKRLDEMLADAAKQYSIAHDKFTEKQLMEAFKQALACGDFIRYVSRDNDSQQVVYIPFAREAELQIRILELEAKPERCGGCGRYIITPITGDVGICICSPKAFWLDTPAAQKP